MFRFSILALYFLFLGTCQSNAESTPNAQFSLLSKGYNISTQANASKIDEKWAKYFYDHLKNRVTDPQRVILNGSNTNFLNLKVKVDNSLSYDYCLKNENKQWLITAKTERSLKWLIYQFIKKISEDDSSVQAPDLNPSIINLNKKCSNFSFAYREPYFLPNLNEDFNQIYNSNTIVSDSPKNKALGSTTSNATPSVSFMINKLAERFPKHTFFTSSYLTTKTPPAQKLANNTGVIISTIDIPKGIALNNHKATQEFYNTLQQWKSKTSEIYLWDYACDFDDYFTPYPILKGFQKQLKSFKEKGVKGVFINGSGYDYSSFNDVQTFVMTSLLIDETLSVDDLVTRFFKQYYPISGSLLTDFYLSLENAQQQKNRPLLPYGNFTNALQTYLSVELFVNFYDKLGAILPKTQGEEHKALEKLYSALSFTRLQIAYTNGFNNYGFAQRKDYSLLPQPQVQQWIDALNKSSKYKEMARYQEDEKGSVKGYINQWKALLTRSNLQNLILGEQLIAKSTLDEDYQNLSVLTDGLEGFPLDYHIGWVINSIDDLKVLLPSQSQTKKAKKIALSFLQNEEGRFYMPTKIEIYKNDKLYKTMVPPIQTGVMNRIITTDVDLSDSNKTEVRIYRNTSKKRNLMATSEIRLIP